MNKKVISILFAALFLVFIGIMDYPFVMRLVNESRQTAAAQEYRAAIAGLSEAQKEQYLDEAKVYNQKLASGTNLDLAEPFTPSENPEAQDPEYRNALAVQDDGIMAVLEIPGIGLTLPVRHGTGDEVLEHGAGHLEGSSLPVGGADTHACIAAHRGLPGNLLFTNLDQVKEDDLFYIEVLGETLAYRVYEVEVVTPEYMEPLAIKPGEDLVTLITCTPYGINSHRIYVHGVRTEYEKAGTQEPEGFWKTYWWMAVTLLLLVWMGGLLYWFNRKRGGRR